MKNFEEFKIIALEKSRKEIDLRLSEVAKESEKIKFNSNADKFAWIQKKISFETTLILLDDYHNWLNS